MSTEDEIRRLRRDVDEVRAVAREGLSGMHLIVEQQSDSLTHALDRIEALAERVTVLGERTPLDIKERLTVVEGNVGELVSHRREITSRFRTMEIDSAKDLGKRTALDDRSKVSAKVMTGIVVALITGVFSVVVQIIRFFSE